MIYICFYALILTHMSYYTIVDMFLDIPEGEVLVRLSILDSDENGLMSVLRICMVTKQ